MHSLWRDMERLFQDIRFDVIPLQALVAVESGDLKGVEDEGHTVASNKDGEG